MKPAATHTLSILMILSLVLFSTPVIVPADTLSFSCGDVTQIPQTECEALVALYNTTGGDYWTYNANWLVTNKPSDWYGVSVSSGHVTGIHLDSNQLTGSIPPELGNLAALERLYLFKNQLSGSIPPELGNLTALEHLYLYENQLTGSIPPELGNLTALQELWLQSNQLTGSIPPELTNLTALHWLRLSNNQLTGSIPPELGNLAALDHLYLTGNQLTGSIPPELGNLGALRWLNLGENQLTGSIPPELGNLAALEHLSLEGNQVTGNISPELGNLTALQDFWLQNNQFTGSIPPELGNLAALRQLRLHNNQLAGSIPPELGNLAMLYWLSLSSNPLTGSIPPSFTNLSGLYFFEFADTGLCELTTPEYLAWKATVAFYSGTGVSCVEPCTLLGFGDADGNPIQQKTDEMKVPYGGQEYTLPDGTTVFLPFRYTPPTDYIYEWGCKLISGVMIINYFAAQQGEAHRTDPISLNNWMAHNIANNNSGYKSGNPYDDSLKVNTENPTHVRSAGVNPVTLVEYARAHGIDMALDYNSFSRNDDRLSAAMCNLNPAILGVRTTTGHYVAASAKTVVGDIATWRLHDPLASVPTNLLDAYGNSYGSLEVFTRSKPKSAIMLALYSPAEIIVTDPEGRRTGIDPRSETEYQEIPSSSYGQEVLEADDGTLGTLEHKVLSILTPVSGEYLIELIGTGSGAIGLDIVTVASSGVASKVTISDTVVPDEVIEYELDYSSTPVNLFLPVIEKW
jgi:Leucine-rich repeat (LRR) protein